MFGARSALLSFCFSPVCIPLAAQIPLEHTGPRLDCSHFVQAVDAHAGLPYDDPSGVVLSGIDHRRITEPEPGHVIVWQGHIGIVIDPREHSVVSLVNEVGKTWPIEPAKPEDDPVIA